MKVLGAGTLAVALPSRLTAQPASDEKKPNILFIISDQHGADVMSCAGNKDVRTPSLDRLAGLGVRFNKAYVTNPLCIPSRASYMTGKMPSQCRQNVEAHKSLANYMKEAGYDTGYFGKWHIRGASDSSSNPWHGFDTIDTRGLDPAKAKKSIEFIKRERDKPFFMISSFMNPHDICQWARIHSGVDDPMENGDIGQAPDPSKCPQLPANFEPPADEPEVVRKRLVASERMRKFTHPTAKWTGDDWRQYRWAYCRLVELVDGHIGEIIDALEESGQLENTLIVYSSDHGDGFSAHRWNQKMVLYEEAARLPLIVSWKGRTRADVFDDRLVSVNLDLLPTLCDFAGIETPKQLRGISLRHLVMADFKSDSSEPHHPFVVTETRLYDEVEGRMLTTGRFKYIVYSEGANPEQLFDLENDPGEMNSLAKDPRHRSQLERHRKLLEEWTASISDSFTLDHVS